MLAAASVTAYFWAISFLSSLNYWDGITDHEHIEANTYDTRYVGRDDTKYGIMRGRALLNMEKQKRGATEWLHTFSVL